MRKKIKLLWWSDACIPTGFGDASDNILKGLHQTGNYEIDVLAIGYYPPYGEKSNYYPYKVYSMGYKIKGLNVGFSPAQQDNLGILLFDELIKTNHYDIIIIHGDIWIWKDMQLIERCPSGQKIIAYLAVDSEPFFKEWANYAQKFTKVITYAQYSMQVLNEAGIKDVGYIPLGVDTQVFYPISLHERQKAKRELGWEDKFIIMTVGRNQYRKYYPEMFMAFKEFKKYVPKSIFYCHTDKNDKTFWAWEMDKLIEALKINDVFFPKEPYISSHELNIRYNIADVILFLTAGEGFGKCTLEALSAGKPVVINDNSANPELVQKDRGILIPDKGIRFFAKDYGRIRPMPDVKLTTEALLYLYQNPKIRIEMGNNARKFAKTMGWEKVVKKWDEVIKKVFNIL